VAPYTVFDVGSRKDYLVVLSMFYSNFTSTMHCFRYNDVFLHNPNDLLVISPLGGSRTEFSMTFFEKGDHDFLFVFQSNFTSIVHRFRDIYVFLQSGNQGLLISPLGGAAQSFP
jgi:hypothetical protein